MGILYYGLNATPIEIDDRLLAHVKVVMATKLRRNESFTLTWTHGASDPEGRSTIWVQAAIPLRFVFSDPEPARLEPDLLEQLARGAGGAGGMIIPNASRTAGEPAAAS